jgi:predicted GH43/DUF377 family glycosyl hydrolase
MLRPDPARVLFRPLNAGGEQQLLRLLARVLALSEDEVTRSLDEVLAEFHPRHQRLQGYLLSRFRAVQNYLPTNQSPSEKRQLLIGAYFTHEYSLEAAALFNPSIVPHPDQSGVAEGSMRFILSLRATGEGHISSITFRTGIVGAQGSIQVDKPTRFVSSPDEIIHPPYNKTLFLRKLQELGVADNLTEFILESLPDPFSVEELVREMQFLRRNARYRNTEFDRAVNRMLALAKSNYELNYNSSQTLTERVIFPTAPNESNGIEDARFVRFVEDDGAVSYMATYTAYDGRVAIPQILETDDFQRFRVSTLNGPEVHNKGMALFPRRIKGCYAMLSRQDGENLYLMYSEDLHFWYTKQPLLKPTFGWEFVKIGNCGSPIETEKGWLVLSHGVGPMRKYSIGAFLLDRDDPSRVIGRLPEPLVSPNENEREGYVPNVVYTCGAMVHAGVLILPYAMSDSTSSFATVALDELLSAMQPVKG